MISTPVDPVTSNFDLSFPKTSTHDNLYAEFGGPIFSCCKTNRQTNKQNANRYAYTKMTHPLTHAATNVVHRA